MTRCIDLKLSVDLFLNILLKLRRKVFSTEKLRVENLTFLVLHLGVA